MKQKIFNLLVLPGTANIGQVAEKFSFPVNLTRGSFKHLEFVFQRKKTAIFHKGIDLKKFSFIWLSSSWDSRDLAYAVKLYLEKNNVPYTYVEKSTSKITDHMAFALQGIQTPDTLFLDYKQIEKCLPQIQDVCGYPLVVKDIKGSRGARSLLIDAEKNLLKEMKKLPRQSKYLFQRYIPNEYDWGVVVANGKVVSGEKSYPQKGEFRNNACNGAEEIFVDSRDIPVRIQKMAIQSSDALGLAWSRSDIIIDKNTQKHYLMEVNRLPGLTSKTSEIDGAYAFLSYQVEKML